MVIETLAIRSSSKSGKACANSRCKVRVSAVVMNNNLSSLYRTSGVTELRNGPTSLTSSQRYKIT